MVTFQISLPDEAAAEYTEAADRLNKDLLPTRVRVTPNTLMALALCGEKAPDLCARFELGLRVITSQASLPHPVLS